MAIPQLDPILQKYEHQGRSGLLPALIDVQDAAGYLSEELVTQICERLDVPLSDAYGVADFYSMLYTEPVGKRIVRVCDSAPCLLAGGHEVAQAAAEHLGIEPGETTPDGKTTLELVPCLGACDCAPAMLVDEELHTHLTAERTVSSLEGGPPGIFHQHMGVPDGLEPILLKHRHEDRHLLEHYVKTGGYEGLQNVLVNGMTPDQLISEIEDSGLVGRGGAAFPTWLKPEFAADRSGPKYVICNADESEPGTFKDRWLLRYDPFTMIEGLTLIAYTIDAAQGYIYIRGEYITEVERVQDAVDEAYANGYLGENILDSGFSFDVELRRGAGAYICGEETALFESIEGKRGMPRQKPPFPTTHGLFGQPTVINNVETLANIPHIVLNGGQWYTRWGTQESPGTRLFCLSGHVKHPGVYELPMGFSLKDLIYDLGGGIREGRELQAVVCGGAAGTFIPPEEVDVPLTFEGIREVGGTLGSGAVMVFDDTVDLWNVSLNFAEFFAHESCGKCFPCQIGTQRQMEILTRIQNGEGPKPGDDDLLKDVGAAMTDASICGLGQTAALAPLSALEHWGLPESNGTNSE